MAYAVRVQQNPATPTQMIVLWSDGHLRSVGAGAVPVFTPPVGYWDGGVNTDGTTRATDMARDFVVTDWVTPSGYVLDGWGGIHAFGGAIAPTGYPYTLGIDAWRAIAMDPAANGAGYSMNYYGRVERFGGSGGAPAPAALPGQPAEQWSIDIARDLWLDWTTKKYWILDANGGVQARNGATANTQTGSWPGFDIACAIAVVDVALGKGYVLDRWGGKHPFGGAAAIGGDPYWQGHAYARDLLISPEYPALLRYTVLDIAGVTWQFVVSAPPVTTVLSPAGGHLATDGTANSWASTPDTAVLDIVGDLDLRSSAAATDWTSAVQTLVAHWLTTGNQRSYMLQVDATGHLVLSWSNNGTAVLSATSTVVLPTADGSKVAVRATLDVDNGAAGRDIKFYTSTDEVTWTQLGATVTQAGVTSIFASTALGGIGAHSGGATERFTGRVYWAEIRTGIDGVIVANPDWRHAVTAAATITDGTTKVWTTGAAASVAVSELDTTRPFISWGYADVDGNPMIASEVAVFTAAQYGIGGFDPATSPATYRYTVTSASTRGVTLDVDLANTTYRAYVRTEDLSGLWSAWAYRQWVQTTTPPTVPTTTAVGTATPTPRATVTVNGAGGDAGKLAEVQWSDDAGTTWTGVRDGEALVLDGSGDATVIDYDIPLLTGPHGSARRYRSRVYTAVGLYSAWSTSGIVSPTVPATSWWLGLAEDPTTHRAVSITRDFTIEKIRRTGVAYAQGREDAIVSAAGIMGEAGTAPIYALDADTRRWVDSLIEDGRTMLLRDVLGRAWYIQNSGRVPNQLLVAAPLAGEASPIRDANLIPISFVTVAAPT